MTRTLFEGTSAVERSMCVGGVQFRVIGVMDKRGEAGGFRDQDDVVLAPITVVRTLTRIEPT